MKKKQDKTYEDIIGPQPPRVWLIVSTIGMLLIMAGIILPMFQMSVPLEYKSPVFRYVFASGAAMLLVARIFSPYKGTDTRVKRLYRVEAWSAVFFCVGAFFLFYEPGNGRDWLAFTLAGGAIQIYSSIMIPRAIRKALKNKNEQLKK